MMPDMNGYEVLEHVKADAALRDIPDHHDLGARRDRQRHPLHRARRRGLSAQAVQPDAAARARRRLAWKRSACATRCEEISRGSKKRWMRRARCSSACCRVSFRRAPRRSRSQCMRLMEPAREVGGDLYDCFYAGEQRFAFWSATSPAKGASAAMFMARTRSLVRMAVELWRQWRTDEVAAGADRRSGQPRALPEQSTIGCSSRCSSACWIPGPACSTYVNAGHLGPASAACFRLASNPDRRQAGNAARRSRRRRNTTSGP